VRVCVRGGRAIPKRKPRLRRRLTPSSLAPSQPISRALPHLYAGDARDDEARRLLEAAPEPRRTVYLMVLNTRLRRKELKLVRWGDFDLEAAEPCLRLPAAITKNGKKAQLPLGAELVAALNALLTADTAPFQLVIEKRFRRWRRCGAIFHGRGSRITTRRGGGWTCTHCG
jgi:integrase